MKNKLMLIMLLGMFLISFTSALDSLGTFKQNQPVNITQICNDATYITISSVSYPNSSIAIGQVNMTSLGSGEFYKQFENTSTIGRYDVRGVSDGCDKVFATYFVVTPSGYEGTQVINLSIWILFAITIILFIAYLFVNTTPPIKWTFFILSMMFLLQTVSILFTGMQDEVANPKIVNYFSFLATSSFILFWFAFGILIVIWILTTFQTILFNKKQKKMEKYG
jgi:hypothetical protein